MHQLSILLYREGVKIKDHVLLRAYNDGSLKTLHPLIAEKYLDFCTPKP
jgi:hypothetical protein